VLLGIYEVAIREGAFYLPKSFSSLWEKEVCFAVSSYPREKHCVFLVSLEKKPSNKKESLLEGLSFLREPIKTSKKGRIMLPKELREAFFGVGSVYIIGAKDYLELWPKEEWNKRIDGQIEKRQRTIEKIS